MTWGRRAALVVLLVLLAGGGLLPALPAAASTVRFAGVGLLWWYAVLVAPVAGAAIVALVLGCAGPPPRADAVGPWVGPALVAALAGRVFAGEADAPLLVLAAALAPLAAAVGPRVPTGASPAVADLALTATIGLVLWAHLVVAGDLAVVLGSGRAAGVGLAAVVVGMATLGRASIVWRARVLGAGAVALAAPLVAIGAAADGPPWTAWSRLGAAPLAFGERSPWVIGAATIRRPTTLTFSEPHRVTTLEDGVFRVIERDGGEVTVRDWRLAEGAALSLRAGDQLTLAPGARVRFEAGKRVPDAAVTGTDWADPRARSAWPTSLGFLGACVTLVGGAIALAAPGAGGRGLGALAGPGILLTIVVGAACWGIYGALSGPDLGLGAPPIAPLAGLPLAVLPSPHGAALVGVVILGLVALLMAVGAGLRERFVRGLAPGKSDAAAERRLGALWAGLIVVAALCALGSVDAWRVLTVGLGLGAATVVAPALAGTGPPRPAAILAGTVVFGAALLAPPLPGLGSLLTDFPALAGVPAAWAAAALLRRR